MANSSFAQMIKCLLVFSLIFGHGSIALSQGNEVTPAGAPSSATQPTTRVLNNVCSWIWANANNETADASPLARFLARRKADEVKLKALRAVAWRMKLTDFFQRTMNGATVRAQFDGILSLTTEVAKYLEQGRESELYSLVLPHFARIVRAYGSSEIYAAQVKEGERLLATKDGLEGLDDGGRTAVQSELTKAKISMDIELKRLAMDMENFLAIINIVFATAVTNTVPNPRQIFGLTKEVGPKSIEEARALGAKSELAYGLLMNGLYKHWEKKFGSDPRLLKLGENVLEAVRALRSQILDDKEFSATVQRRLARGELFAEIGQTTLLFLSGLVFPSKAIRHTLDQLLKTLPDLRKSPGQAVGVLFDIVRSYFRDRSVTKQALRLSQADFKESADLIEEVSTAYSTFKTGTSEGEDPKQFEFLVTLATAVETKKLWQEVLVYFQSATAEGESEFLKARVLAAEDESKGRPPISLTRSAPLAQRLGSITLLAGVVLYVHINGYDMAAAQNAADAGSQVLTVGRDAIASIVSHLKP